MSPEKDQETVTFVTSSPEKAALLSKYLGLPVNHKSLELDELQMFDLHAITQHKVLQAFVALQSPVLVEDVALTFNALGQLPGPFIKWFFKSLGNQGLCDLMAHYSDKNAVVAIAYAYYDGQRLEFFEAAARGIVAPAPRGEGGFGWNAIFIPEGYQQTYAEMSEEQRQQTGLRESQIYPKIKNFLLELEHNKQ